MKIELLTKKARLLAAALFFTGQVVFSIELQAIGVGEIVHGTVTGGHTIHNAVHDPILSKGTEAKSGGAKTAETAEQAAERVAKERAAQVEQRYKELEGQGHAPARHGEQVTETKLDERAMHGKDPITGTTDDAYNKFPDGTPMPHNYSKDATKFTGKEALVKAEEYIKNSTEYKDALAVAESANVNKFAVKDIKLQDIYGAKYKDQVFGKTRVGSKNHPTGSVETDFTDGTIKAVFQKDSSGNWNVLTMYPEPK